MCAGNRCYLIPISTNLLVLIYYNLYKLNDDYSITLAYRTTFDKGEEKGTWTYACLYQLSLMSKISKTVEPSLEEKKNLYIRYCQRWKINLISLRTR